MRYCGAEPTYKWTDTYRGEKRFANLREPHISNGYPVVTEPLKFS